MALNFPNSPSVGDIYEDSTSGFSYQWDGTFWKSYKVNTDSLGGNLDAELNLNSKDITGTGDVDTTGNLKISGIATASSFVKSSGTSSQFLKADGSVDSSTYLTSYTETNDLSSAVTWANVPNANITESSVTQHQAALSITESQISDLQTYLTSYTETDPVVAAINGIVKSNGTTISAAVAGTDYLTPSGDGSGLSGLTGASAATYGSAGATPVIVVDSNGRITGISTVSTAGSGSGDVVDDTTPQLGGDLDLNGNDITGTGNINLTGVITATSFTGNLTGNVTGNLDGIVGGTTPAAVTGTTITANTGFVGNVTGNVTGNTSGTAGGLTGSPSITVTDITASGDVSIDGVLTYQDVTNVDSIGIITARSDVSIADKIIHTGDTNTAIRFPAADTFTVETGGSERVRVDSSGRMGLGTNSPGNFAADADDLVVGSGSGNSGITIYSGTSHLSNLYFADGTSGGAQYSGGMNYNHIGNSLAFFTNGGQTRMSIDSSGQILMGSSSSTFNVVANQNNAAALHLSGGGSGSANIELHGSNHSSDAKVITFDTNNAERMRIASDGNVNVYGNFTASGNVTAYSDITLKKDIELIPNALDKILSLRGVTYNRIDIEDEPRHSGVIAQEVEEVLPEVVMTDENGVKSVAYGNMVGLLIEAIKELKDEIETLKKDRN